MALFLTDRPRSYFYSQSILGTLIELLLMLGTIVFAGLLLASAILWFENYGDATRHVSRALLIGAAAALIPVALLELLEVHLHPIRMARARRALVNPLPYSGRFWWARSLMSFLGEVLAVWLFLAATGLLLAAAILLLIDVPEAGARGLATIGYALLIAAWAAYTLSAYLSLTRQMPGDHRTLTGVSGRLIILYNLVVGLLLMGSLLWLLGAILYIVDCPNSPCVFHIGTAFFIAGSSAILAGTLLNFFRVLFARRFYTTRGLYGERVVVAPGILPGTGVTPGGAFVAGAAAGAVGAGAAAAATAPRAPIASDASIEAGVPVAPRKRHFLFF